MLKDYQETLEDILLYLTKFEEVWKSPDMKSVFPKISKDRIENLEQVAAKLPKRDEIKKAFSDWKGIGVWNASDFITFLLTSRLTIYLADCVENKDAEGIRQAIKYLLYFINYLLLTNIHPPSKSHGDFEPYHPEKVPFPQTYERAQDTMRTVIAKSFSNTIWSDKNLKEEFEQILDHGILSREALSKQLKEKFLREKTPPLLLKNVGLAKELFVFYKLISKNIGFLLPTLLYQRIFKGLKSIISGQERLVLVRVPDFIIIKGGRTMGIELGRERAFFRTQKGVLVTTFSGACAIPTTQINVVIGNPVIDKRNDFGFKCNRCFRSFTLCKAFIEGEIGESVEFDSLNMGQLTCERICGEQKAKKCPDAAVMADILNHRTGRTNKKLIHYRCLCENEVSDDMEIIPLFPTLDGIEALEEGLS